MSDRPSPSFARMAAAIRAGDDTAAEREFVALLDARRSESVHALLRDHMLAVVRESRGVRVDLHRYGVTTRMAERG